MFAPYRLKRIDFNTTGIYIYIYIYRERERKRESEKARKLPQSNCSAVAMPAAFRCQISSAMGWSIFTEDYFGGTNAHTHIHTHIHIHTYTHTHKLIYKHKHTGTKMLTPIF